MRQNRPSISSTIRCCLVIIALLSPHVGLSQSIQDQGAQCELELQAHIPTFNCLDGSIVPLTHDGNPIVHYDINTTCDRPPLLPDVSENGNQCVPYSRLQSQALEHNDLFWTLLCRRYVVRDEADPRFEDIALIGHRKSTGLTCFFQTLADEKGVQSLDGSHVPSPTAPRAQDFWLTPREIKDLECFRCHDNDPWIHTPYIDQVGGPNAVPRNPRGKYRFVQFIGLPDQWPVPTFFALANNRCVGCHRIGTGATSNQFTELSTGKKNPKNVTDSFKLYPHSHWMPEPNRKATKGEWDAEYSVSVDRVLYCHRNPNEAGCNRQEVPAIVSFATHTERGLAEPETFASEIGGCEMMGYRVAFGATVPWKSAAFVEDKCFCGVRDGVSPEDAKRAGWRATSAKGVCTCEFKAGSKADNACATP